MEDIDQVDTTRSKMPEGLNDPEDPLNPDIDEENTADPPIGAPSQDMDIAEDDENDDASDDQSELSDVDEAQFEDFDPTAIAIEDRPALAVDETNVGLLGVHKRRRTDGDEGGKKKKREGRREKTKKSRKRREDDEENFSGGEEIDGKRERRKREKVKPTKTIDDEDLTPQERRKRALDAAMDAALKNPNRRRKQAGIDVEKIAEDEVEDMRTRMTHAAAADAAARAENKPAIHKLQLLPQVLALLNRNTLQNQIVDPDINLLEAVRFFLEPLPDGSLPALNIQRELFTVLAKLPITKDALVASGIGKVTLFYTKSKRPEQSIRRQAEKLVQEWSRPILRRTDDYRKRGFVEANYDPNMLPNQPKRVAPKPSQSQGPSQAPSGALNRARVEGGVQSYTIVPRSAMPTQGYAKSASAIADKAFNRIKARQQGKSRGTR